LNRYRYEHIFINNASMHEVIDILKRLGAEDRNVKI
jgi:hypothetical protein